MKKSNKHLYAGGSFLLAFILWTVAVSVINVQKIGPEESAVGFATINRFVHQLTGVHFAIYNITDVLSIVPVAVVLGFGLFGLYQWIKGRSLKEVDRSIFALGGFYIATMAAFVLFEKLEVNYRPVLIEGRLEASYPSSTTLLVMCVMPTAILQLNNRIKNKAVRLSICAVITVFIAFMVIGRLISGVHWFTDIVGGALLSAGLVELYRHFAK